MQSDLALMNKNLLKLSLRAKAMDSETIVAAKAGKSEKESEQINIKPANISLNKDLQEDESFDGEVQIPLNNSARDTLKF